MEATITPRQGCPPDDVPVLKMNQPAQAPDRWLTRDEAAEALGVGVRTIDRYLRRRELSYYRGPVPKEGSAIGGGNGVRIWRADVERYPHSRGVTVVAQ